MTQKTFWRSIPAMGLTSARFVFTNKSRQSCRSTTETTLKCWIILLRVIFRTGRFYEINNFWKLKGFARYSRLQEPAELYRSQIDEGAPESAAMDDFSAHLESDLMGNITENMLLRRGDWPNMFPNETFDQATGTIYDWWQFLVKRSRSVKEIFSR